jgi:hypothetical protein
MERNATVSETTQRRQGTMRINVFTVTSSWCGCRSYVPTEPETLGTRIVQADSGSDSDSETRNKNEESILVNRLNLSAPTGRSLPPQYAPALLNKGHSLSQSAQRMSFVYLPALYAYPLSSSSSGLQTGSVVHPAWSDVTRGHILKVHATRT